MENASTITVRPNEGRHRYELVGDAGRVVGKAHWLPFEGATGPERIFYHTTVDEEYGGQGLAAMLAHFALEDTIAAGVKIVPVCPYIKIYLRKHPEYQEHAMSVRPEHLAAVTPAAK